MTARVAAALAGALLAACSGPPPAATPELVRGPYLQLVGARSAVVVWRTSAPALCGLLVHPLDGATTTVVGGTGTTCAIPVDDLTPGTAYGYVPTAGGAPLAPEAVFRTDDPAAPFTALVIGDSGSGDANQRAVRDRMLATPADLILHTGDMVYEDGRAEDFDARFFEPYAELLRRVVLWPCRGNHDVRTAGGQPWRDAFYTPANNPSRSEDYYSFDHGNAHVVVLDSTVRLGPRTAQYAFLAEDLAASRATWKLVVFHHTIYSSGAEHGSNLALRAALVPLFDAHGVDIVFMGHEHTYERTLPLRADVVVAPGVGTVYVTTGGGGDKTYAVGRSAFTAYSESVHHLVRVVVDGGTLGGTMLRADGSVGDTFRLEKAAGGKGMRGGSARTSPPGGGRDEAAGEAQAGGR